MEYSKVDMFPQCRKYSSLYSLPRLRYCQIRAERHKKLYSVALVRHASSDNKSWQNDIPEGYIPDIPVVPSIENLDKIPPLAELNSIGEPTLQSIGLGGYWPPGLVQHCFEALHVGLDIPWWTAISIGVVIIRLLILPMTIEARKVLIRNSNISPKVTKMQKEVNEARAAHDHVEVKQGSERMMKYMQDNGVSLSKLLMPLLVQGPIFLTVFIGLRRMAEYPVLSMKTGGMLWFEDLTQNDPTMLLPALSAGFLFINMKIGAETMKAKATDNPITRNMHLIFPLITFGVSNFFPAALVWYWMNTNMFVLGQVLILKIPAVKKALDMPEEIKHKPEDMPKPRRYTGGFFKGIRDSLITYQKGVEADNRERMKTTQFKDADVKPPLKKSWKDLQTLGDPSQSIPNKQSGPRDLQKEIAELKRRENK